jgi:DNA-binding MarR family transcriptional regulator
MDDTNYELNLEARANLFKSLGHPTRLLILNLIKSQPRHGQELAEILRMNPSTISHHLKLLTEAGLLRQKKDQYYQIYTLKQQYLGKSLADLVHLPQPELSSKMEEDAYRYKVLRSFFRRGRLVQVPAQLKKRLIVLEKIAESFEPERDYTEMEVNHILLDFNDDVATLRRGMIEHEIMTRDKGIYKKEKKSG